MSRMSAKSPDLVQQLHRMQEEIRQLRLRQPASEDYVLTSDDFYGETISGTFYGWASSGFSALPLRLVRYGDLLNLTGCFKRLWTDDGTTPPGYAAQIYQIFRNDNVPALARVLSDGYRVLIARDVNASQNGDCAIYRGEFDVNGLEIALPHVDYDDIPADPFPQVPGQRTVYFTVDITVPVFGA